MAHHHNNSLYERLVERINQFPQGAPPSAALYRILQILFSEKEAGLVAQLPIRPFTAATAAHIWKMSQDEARVHLDALASRAMLLDMEQNGEQRYCLPPPMAGFFEFSLMRTRNDIDQKALSALFYQYLNVEEDFVRALFVGLETPLGRIFADETVLARNDALDVLDYERASHIIRTASHRGISQCYCRHKMEHMGQVCGAPQDICMTFNTSARSLIKHGHARAVSVEECLELLSVAQENRLVQFGENGREGINFICNCCGCCCEALLAVQRFAIARTIRSNFMAVLTEACGGCGACVTICPVKALEEAPREGVAGEEALDNAGNASATGDGATKKKRRRRIRVLADRCIGCGVCARSCPNQAMRLEARPERAVTPLNTAHRVVLAAVEKGMLKELLQDNNAQASHRIMAAVIGSLVKAPGPLRDMAVRQLKSRYMERVFRNL